MNYSVLKNEIDTDPLVRGYAGMTDEEAASDINTQYRSFTRDSISGEDLARLSARDDLVALPDRAFNLWKAYLVLDTISLAEGTETRNLLAALFPQGSATRNNILAFISENIPQSRSQELGLGNVSHTDITKVRKW